jgi:hypothetical protein
MSLFIEFPGFDKYKWEKSDLLFSHFYLSKQFFLVDYTE